MARRNPKLDAIYAVFDKHNVEIDRDSIWEVQGTPVIKHKDVERLGAKLGISWSKPEILRAERDEAVILCMGEAGGKTEWSIGEALIAKEGQVGGNYRIKGKMSAYPYAMAEKRAKDRVILKLADLHGDAYSSEEADDFNEREQDRRDNRPSNDNARDEQRSSSGGSLFRDLEKDVLDCKSIKDVTDLMNSKGMKDSMQDLSKKEVDDLRAIATQQLKDLGWTKPAKAEAAAG